MKEVLKDAQIGLRDHFGYKGDIDGLIGRKSESSLDRIPWVNKLWGKERKAYAYVQFRLNSKGARLTIDGIFGKKSVTAWNKIIGGVKTKLSKIPIPRLDSGFMPEITHDPRWNHNSRPELKAVGIVLHRTAGHFATGDYNVGKYGHYSGSRKGNSLGFHFLVGKKEGESIQFCSIDKKVSHVRKWAGSYIGIELSGDIGQYKDGLTHGENLTDWQIEEVARIISWVCKKLDIPITQIKHEKKMFQHNTPFHGLLAHRDLNGNTHADSPNKKDWDKIIQKTKKL